MTTGRPPKPARKRVRCPYCAEQFEGTSPLARHLDDCALRLGRPDSRPRNKP